MRPGHELFDTARRYTLLTMGKLDSQARDSCGSQFGFVSAQRGFHVVFIHGVTDLIFAKK